MGGNAVLNDDVLVDSLVVDLIDDLRGELHPEFGVRPYALVVIRRVWDGDAVGEGSYHDVETEILPQPRIWNFGSLEQEPGGTNERGEVKITEVSLTYTESELVGEGLGDNEEWLFRIDEAHGQGSRSRLFKLNRPPFVDREKDMGWVLYLRHIDQAGCAP
jgi:hypothetical protein